MEGTPGTFLAVEKGYLNRVSFARSAPSQYPDWGSLLPIFRGIPKALFLGMPR